MFDLTRQERQLACFLIFTALAGVGISYFCKSRTKIEPEFALSCDLGKLDLNSAPQEMLNSVPCIGEKISSRIIEYRKAQRFSAIEELKNIPGISQGKFEKIKDYFLVSS